MPGPAVDLVLVGEFLNTLDARTFQRHGSAHVAGDDLTTPDALAHWFASRDLLGPDERPGPTELETARALRTALRASLADDRPAAAGLAAFPVRLVPAGESGLRLQADLGMTGLDLVVEAVTTSVAGGRWKRLKLCAATDCRWAFYDASRSGGGRWCSMEICGNRHKTRSYRRRHLPADELHLG